jgi:membrane protein implicated in regulation of membrane protease activity
MFNVSQMINLMILPKGTVKNEGLFFLMLSVLIALIIIAIVLRRRHDNDSTEKGKEHISL